MMRSTSGKEGDALPSEEQGQTEQRSLGATLGAAALTGVAAGGANAVTQQLISALTKPKSDQQPPPKKS
jgi:hypothetical protein